MTDPGTFLQAVSPSLARVLANAANAAFIGSPGSEFYIVCRWTDANQGVPAADATLDPYNVQPPQPSYQAALDLAATLNGSPSTDEYGVFGPFEYTHSDLPSPPNQATIASMLVTAQGGPDPDGDVFPIPGQAADALFWSIEAVQKFVVPYYVETYGPEFGNVVLQQFNEAPIALVAHLPWSEYEEVGPGGVFTQMSDDAGPGPGGGGGAKVTAAQAQAAGEKKWMPVFFHRDACGKVHRRPLHPPRQGQS